MFLYVPITKDDKYNEFKWIKCSGSVSFYPQNIICICMVKDQSKYIPRGLFEMNKYMNCDKYYCTDGNWYIWRMQLFIFALNDLIL